MSENVLFEVGVTLSSLPSRACEKAPRPGCFPLRNLGQIPSPRMHLFSAARPGSGDGSLPGAPVPPQDWSPRVLEAEAWGTTPEHDELGSGGVSCACT